MKKLLFTLLLAAVTLPGWAEDLYIVGDATLLSDAGNPGYTGWAVGSGNRTLTHMTEEPSNVFTWKGLLKKGNFKICSGESGWNGYHPQTANKEIYADGNAQTMTTDNVADHKWQVVIPGIYNVTVNTSENTITITPDWYDISTADELIAFANYVNAATESNYQGARWARLTADIDMSGKTFPGIGRDNKWQRYHGTFDGQGHKISNLNMTSDYCAFVTIAGGGCTIKNLLIDNTCEFNGTGRIAALISACNYTDFGVPVTIENCGNEANVTGTGNNCAGLLGCNYSGSIHVTIKNCFNTGNISSTGNESAPISGWTGANATISNTWNIGEIANEPSNNNFLRWDSNGSSYTNCFTTLNWGSTITGKTIGYDASKVSTGEFCYKLNGDQSSINWYQNITSGTVDSHPVPFSTHEKVYKFGAADTYLNDGSNVPISSATDLDNFSAVVNDGATSLNATLTASFSANAALTPIGTSTNMYKGTFDGGGNSITLRINNTDANVSHRALIGYATDGATIQNLILKGSVKSSGGVTAGFIAETSGGGTVTITNCGNEATISGGANETAAIIANNKAASCALLLTNVYNIADVSGSGGVSTICGYQANYQSVFENVYNSGTPTVTSGTLEGHFARGTINQNNGNPLPIGIYTRCYSTTLNSNTRHDYPDVTNIRKIEVSDVSSGELTCLLNGSTNGGTNFYQTLGTDAHPVLDSTHGKVWKCLCTESNAEIRYANSAIGQSTTHAFNEPNSTGYCSQCLNYNVSTGAQMKSIADGISAGTIDNDIKIYFTQDIDFAGVAGYAGIGTDNDGKRFCGLLDGQDHFVMNMNVDSNQSGVGLIGTASDGADIKNVIVTSSCTVKGNQYVAGIVGSTNGNGTGTIKITRCGNEAAIQATNGNNSNAAGILGCRRGSNRIEISNCYNTGTITGINESAGICAWTGKKFKIEKCYNNGTISGTIDSNQYFARFDGGDWDASSTIADCYQINDNNDNDGTAVYNKTYSKNDNTYTVKAIPADSIASGQLCYALGSDIWWQTLGVENSHPIPFSTSKTVYRYNNAGSYLYSNLDKNASKVSISSAKDLNDFSALVNEGNYNLNAELTNDIDMTDKSWTPIGKFEKSDNNDNDDKNDGSKAYRGTFDGKNFTIDNLVQSSDNTDNNQGLFGVVRDGCTIQNLILGSGCQFYGGKFVGAFVGSARGSQNGTITITNCGNDATVGSPTTEANRPTQHAAAFIGVVVNDNSPKVHIYNCYNKGNIYGKSGSNSAILTGWFGSNSDVEVKNFYNIGTVTNPQDDDHPLYRRGSNLSSNAFDNVYHTLAKQDATEIQEGWLISGELCYRLNGSVDNGTDWYQDLSEEGYPIPFGTKTVAAGKWFNSSDNDVYYNKEGDDYTVYQLNMSDTNEEYKVPAKVTAKNVKMTRTLKAEVWNTFCSPVAIAKSNFSAVKKLSGATQNGENYTMNFTDETAEYLEAGKPYMVQVQVETPIKELSATNVPVANAASASGPFNGLSFNGTFTNGKAPEGSFIISNNKFYNVDSDVTLKAFRGYITTASAGVKALTFDFDDDATSLSSISSPEGKECIYNLAGQRINKMQKGINIVNGKKILK